MAGEGVAGTDTGGERAGERTGLGRGVAGESGEVGTGQNTGEAGGSGDEAGGKGIGNGDSAGSGGSSDGEVGSGHYCGGVNFGDVISLAGVTVSDNFNGFGMGESG